MTLLKSAGIVLTKRLNEGATPLGHLKSTGFGKYTIRNVNIILRRYTDNRDEKLRLVRELFDLPCELKSTYELTVGQASALIRLDDFNQKLLDSYVLKIKENTNE